MILGTGVPQPSSRVAAEPAMYPWLTRAAEKTKLLQKQKWLRRAIYISVS